MKTTKISGAIDCDGCPVPHGNGLQPLGIETGAWDFIIALAGNPNTGKSTVFNALTGLRQHTGNWPGKTVTRAEGGFEYRSKRFRLIDLPGTYSLLATSIDEEIARDFLLFGRPDLAVVVVDATRLERNLNLVLQVLSITDRAVVCLNLMDEAQRNGLEIDHRGLARRLGVPVVPTAARHKQGLNELLDTIYNVATGDIVCRPLRAAREPVRLRSAADRLAGMLSQAYPTLSNARWVALRLLDGDRRIIQAVRQGELLPAAMDTPRKANRT